MDLPRLLETFPSDLGAIQIDPLKKLVIFYNEESVPHRLIQDILAFVGTGVAIGVRGPVRESIAVVEFDKEKKET